MKIGARSKVPGLHKNPDWDSGPHYAGLSPTDFRKAINPRKGIAQVTCDNLEQLSLFSSGHGGQELLSLSHAAQGSSRHYFMDVRVKP